MAIATRKPRYRYRSAGTKEWSKWRLMEQEMQITLGAIVIDGRTFDLTYEVEMEAEITDVYSVRRGQLLTQRWPSATSVNT